MIANILLKSCASPPASLPTAFIFCACRSCSSDRFCAVMSRAIADAPTILPSASSTGEMETDTLSLRPSFAMRTDSKYSTRSPFRVALSEAVFTLAFCQVNDSFLTSLTNRVSARGKEGQLGVQNVREFPGIVRRISIESESLAYQVLQRDGAC